MLKKRRTKPEPTRLDPFDDRPVPKDIVVATNRRRALDLHKQGRSYSEIADELGIGMKSVQVLVREAVKMLTAEIGEATPEEKRAVAELQLNDLYAVASRERELYLTAMQEFREKSGPDGTVGSLEVLVDLQEHMLRIHGARTKLLGLNAATKVEASGTALIGLADLQQIQAALDANEAPVVVATPELSSP